MVLPVREETVDILLALVRWAWEAMVAMAIPGLLREIHIAVAVAVVVPPRPRPHKYVLVVPAALVGEPQVVKAPQQCPVTLPRVFRLLPPMDLRTVAAVVADRVIHGAVPLDFLASAATEEMVVLAWP